MKGRPTLLLLQVLALLRLHVSALESLDRIKARFRDTWQTLPVTSDKRLSSAEDDEPGLLHVVGAATAGNPSDVTLARSQETGQIQVVSGFSKEFWSIAEVVAKLKVERVVEVSDWGSHQSDLNDTLIGAIALGLADVSLNLMAPCCNRSHVVAMTQPIFTRGFSVAFRQPRNVARDIFLVQFCPQLWFMALAMLTLLVTAMSLIYFFTGKLEAKDDEDSFSALDILSWSLCILSQQGHSPTPQSDAGRLLYFFGFLFGLLCFAGFCANIVTTLTQAKSLRNIVELMNYDKIKIHPSYFAPWQSELEQSQSTLVQQLWQRIEQDLALKPCDDNQDSFSCDLKVVEMIAASPDKEEVDVAYVAPTMWIYDASAFPFMADRQKACVVSHFTVPLGAQPMMYGIRNDSLDLRHRIDATTLRMKEVGLNKKLFKKHVSGPPDCADFDSVGYKKVGIEYVFTAYVVLGMGYGLSIILILLEIIIRMKTASHLQ